MTIHRPLLRALLRDDAPWPWLRRGLTLPAWTVAALLLLLSSPLWASAVVLWDLAGGAAGASVRLRQPKLRTMLFVLVYLWAEVAGILAAAALALRAALAPGWARAEAPNAPGRSRETEAFFGLQKWWGHVLLETGRRLFGLRLRVDGQDLALQGPLLLFIRHSSMADTALALELVSRPGDLLLRYVLKRPLLLDPCLDLVGNRLPNRFASRGTARSRAEIEAVARLAEGLGPKDGVLVYPEGTRFTEAKRRLALSSLERKGDEQKLERAKGYRAVLPPRAGGPLALLRRNLEQERPADLVLCAHRGLDRVVRMQDLASGALLGAEVAVRFWRFPADAMPREPAELERWLWDRWQTVDDFVHEENR